MALTTEVKLSVSRTVNLGNYESVKLEGSVVIGRDNDGDTPESMRERALDEIYALLSAAIKDNVPERLRKSVSEA